MFKLLITASLLLSGCNEIRDSMVHMTLQSSQEVIYVSNGKQIMMIVYNQTNEYLSKYNPKDPLIIKIDPANAIIRKTTIKDL